MPRTKTGLRDAVKTTLLAMIDDGTYIKILTKYGVQADAVHLDLNPVDRRTSRQTR